jgi:hypothetical protein
MDQAVASGDEFRTLLNDGSTSGFVGSVDDESEVFGTHEGRAGGFDEFEALGYPGCGLREAGKIACLPGETRSV